MKYLTKILIFICCIAIAFSTMGSSVSAYVDSLRGEWGRENVILVDAGDYLQGSWDR